MFDFLKSFVGGRSYLGVDIGTTAIKIVEIGGLKEDPGLLNYGILETQGYLNRQNAVIQTGGLKAMEKETAELLLRLMQEAKFKSKDAIASLPSFLAFITFFEIPQMSDEDVVKTLQFQIPQYIPMPAEEAIIDWLPVGERIDETGKIKKQILLIAVPKDAIERYKAIFRRAGLRLAILEVESLSIVRALARNSSEPVLIVDIGSRSTNIVIAHHGFLMQDIQTDFAGASITQAISNGLGINMKRAEELKKQRGIRGTPENAELSTLTKPFLGVILDEVNRARNVFEKNAGIKIGKVILAGGSAGVIGLAEYFKDEIGLPVMIGNPFESVRCDPMLEPLLKELGSSLSVAIGLGIREFTKDKK